MNNKQAMLTTLEAEFNRWEALLGSMSEGQITAPQLPSNMSIKDVVAHLHAWQQRSNAWLEAALLHTEPTFPLWLAGLDPEAEENLDQINAWIYENYRDQPWSSVHQDWHAGFLRLLELGAAIPETDMLDTKKYPWLKGYALFAVLKGSYEHHHADHLEPLLAWLPQHGDIPSGE